MPSVNHQPTLKESGLPDEIPVAPDLGEVVDKADELNQVATNWRARIGNWPRSNVQLGQGTQSRKADNIVFGQADQLA